VKQHGAALLIAVLLIFAVAVFGAIVVGSMSASDITDSSAQGTAVEALFAAETGIERALKQFATGSACTAAALGAANIAVVANRIFTTRVKGSTDFDGATALPQSQCRVEVTGTVSGTNVTRTLQSVLDRNLLAGENPAFNDPIGAPSWVATKWDNTGGFDPATAAPPSCSRAAYSVLASDNGTDASTTGSVAVSPVFTVTGGQAITVRFNWRAIRIGTGSTACNTNSGVVPAIANNDVQFWFSITDTANVTSTSTVLDVVAWDPGAPLNGRTVTSATGCIPTTQRFPGDYSSCPRFYQSNVPANKGQVTITVGGAGTRTINTARFNINITSGNVEMEAWIENIEFIANSGKLAARPKWRDCAVLTCV
jgi:hypothetical protein